MREESALARVKRCDSGLSTFEGIGWLMDGVKLVDGSYLAKRLLDTLVEINVVGYTPPYAHEVNPVPLHRNIPSMLEDVRKPE